MKRCKDIATQASDYLQKDLSFFERLQFCIHLMLCHQCRKFMKLFQCFNHKLTQLPQEKALGETEAEVICSQIKSRRGPSQTATERGKMKFRVLKQQK